MKPSSHYDRVVDLCEELMKFTLLTRRPISSTERKEDAEKPEQRVKLKSI